MALPALEDFTGDNDPLTDRTGWTDLPVTSGDGSGKSEFGLYKDSPATGDDKAAYWDADTFADGQYAQLEIVDGIAGSSRMGLILRASTSTNVATLCRFRGDGNFEFFVWDSGGSRNQIGSAFTPSSTVVNNSIIRVEIDAATDVVTLKIDYDTGTFITETTFSGSTGNSSGQAGIYVANATSSNMEGDNWEAGDLDAGPAPSGIQIFRRRIEARTA